MNKIYYFRIGFRGCKHEMVFKRSLQVGGRLRLCGPSAVRGMGRLRSRNHTATQLLMLYLNFYFYIPQSCQSRQIQALETVDSAWGGNRTAMQLFMHYINNFLHLDTLTFPILIPRSRLLETIPLSLESSQQFDPILCIVQPSYLTFHFLKSRQIETPRDSHGAWKTSNVSMQGVGRLRIWRRLTVLGGSETGPL